VVGSFLGSADTINMKVLSRGILRKLVPFAVRVELLRLWRMPEWFIETPKIARKRVMRSDKFQYCLASQSSPLCRDPSWYEPVLQEGKVRNVALASRRINGLVLRPGKTFSYHRSVGRPSRFRGYLPGLELRDGKQSIGTGGGCCKISNLLYLLALKGGLTITERHRHGLDLFPDANRTVPFGCGATVFYNYADLRFLNPLNQSVRIRLWIQSGSLHGEVWAERNPGHQVEVYEVGHRFFQEEGHWKRENRIRRRYSLPDGTVIFEEEVAHNTARVLYDPLSNS